MPWEAPIPHLLLYAEVCTNSFFKVAKVVLQSTWWLTLALSWSKNDKVQIHFNGGDKLIKY